MILRYDIKHSGLTVFGQLNYNIFSANFERKIFNILFSSLSNFFALKFKFDNLFSHKIAILFETKNIMGEI